MPDVTYSINATLTKGALSQQFVATGVTADISTAGMVAFTLNLGTAVTQISTATMNSLGLCFARSLATTTTHTVQFGRFDGTNLHDSCRLRAGEAAFFRLSPGNYAASAAVEGSRLLLHVVEG